MNGVHSIGEKSIIIGAAAAFSGKADFCGVFFEDIERNMPNDHHVFRRVILPDPAVVLPEGHIQTPGKRIFDSPVLEVSLCELQKYIPGKK